MRGPTSQMRSKLLLHPTVMLNITDHVVRRTNANQLDLPQTGVLLGTISNGDTTATTSFELMGEGEQALPFLYERMAQFKVMHPTLDPVGFYQLRHPHMDTRLCHTLTGVCADPVRLVFDVETTAVEGFRGETMVDVVITTTPVERVSVNTILTLEQHQKQDGANPQMKALALQNLSETNALGLVSEKVTAILAYLEASAALGASPLFLLLRDINALTQKLALILSSRAEVTPNLHGLETDAGLSATLALVLTQVELLDRLDACSERLLMCSKWAERLQIKAHSDGSGVKGSYLDRRLQGRKREGA